LIIGLILQGRYRLDSELGHGGMGVVYRAHDTLLERAVAVKVLSESSLGSEGRARLLREAQAAAKLNHPNIVAIYDAGEVDLSTGPTRPAPSSRVSRLPELRDGRAGRVPFIVMELAEGESLHDRPPHDMDEIVSIAKQLCGALEHAHAHGIVHRDLKPENVVIARDGGVKLMDFGLARSVASRLTAEGALVGTVYYLAPEQALGQDVDGRVDLYALGVMLYELTTGRLPFTADDPLAIIAQHLHAPVVPPRVHNKEIPPTLNALIVRLMSKRPEERPASAAEVMQALAHLDAVVEPFPSKAPSLLDSLVRSRLVGRSSELTALRERWVYAQDGHGHLVLISGEPGIGKTRLAGELIAYARLNGALVLQGACYEYEATTPYLPLIEALRDWVQAQPTQALRSQLGSAAAELAKLAPEIEARLDPLTPNPPLGPDQERLRLFDHLAHFLQALASVNGVLLFVDDMHWADQGTLALVHYLLRRLRNERLLILGAYREVELDRAHPLAAALVEWNRERLTTRIQLGRLTHDECEALLAAMLGQESVSPDFAQAIYRETEGNPFFIEEVIKSLVEQGQISRQDGTWQFQDIADLAVPQSIKEAIGRRLNQLSTQSIEVLQRAAVLGKTFGFTELAAALEITTGPSPQHEDRLLDALDEALAAQLIRAGVGEVFTFTHDKIREVLYEELNPIRRRRLHQRIGEGLERLYEGEAIEIHVQDLAYHFLQSGDFQRGLGYALRAAEQAKNLYAYDEALSYYQQAVDCVEALNLPGRIADITEALGDLHIRRGLFYQAVDAYQQALTLAATGEKRASLKTKIGTAYGQVGDERGLEILHAARSELNPRTQTDELAHTLAMLGRYHHYHAQHLQAIAYLERARELAEPLDHELTLTDLYAYLAGAYQHLARFDQSMQWARQCIAMGERKNYPPALAVGYEFLGEDMVLMGKWQEALGYAQRDREIGENIGSLDRTAWSEFCRAYSLYGLGELGQAHESAQSGLALAEQIGEGRLIIWLGALLGFIEGSLGLDDPARLNAQLALTRADESGQVLLQCWARYALAYLHVKDREWKPALELCHQGAALYAPTENRVAQLYIGLITPQAHYGAGQLEEAEEAIADYLPLVREVQSHHFEGVALRVQGQIYMAQTRWDEAGCAFDMAIAKLEELGSRLELGHALYHRGILRQELGQMDLAHADTARARALFEGCGAQPEIENL
jgi:serine/threonine protein kinase/tetratricopeptide (TPR) repeat protein